MKSSKKLYFAYGSNMDQARLENRIGKVVKLQAIAVPYWKLTFECGWQDRRFANITMTGLREDKVEGVMYELTERQMRNLDNFEGYPYLYQKMAIPLLDGRSMDAYVSFNPLYRSAEGVIAKPEYTQHIINGCKENRLYFTMRKLEEFRQQGLLVFP